MKKTAVIILNWNGSKDTILCLESLLPNLQEEDFLFLIDNGSTDTSLPELQKYFERLNHPLIVTGPDNLKLNFSDHNKNYLVANTDNIGFGGGNNIVLKQLRQLSKDFEFAWLLNNDAVVKIDSLMYLKQKLLSEDNCAAAGSLILNYPDNGLIQCSGVNYYKYLGVSKLVNKNRPWSEVNKDEKIDFDYLNGASLLLNLSALEKSGYFDEDFFLYSEEQDLQLRLQSQNYKLHLDTRSRVYHKLGGATSRKKYLFYYYYNTSAMLLSRKHFTGIQTLSAFFGLLLITFIRTFPSFKSLRWGIKGLVSGLRK